MYQFSPDALDQKVCLKYSHIFSCKLPVNGNWFSAKLTVRRVSGCESFLLHLFLSCHSCWRSLEKASISGWTRKWRATGRQRRGSSLPRAAPEEDRKSGLDTEMHPGLDRTQAVGRACGSLADTWVDDAVAAVPSLTHVRLSVTPCPAARQAALSFTISRSSPKLMSIESVMPSKHLILCRPLLLPSVFPSIRVFPNELALCISWPSYWSFSFNIRPSSEYSGLTSFRIDLFDLAVQGTLKSLLQHLSSKASILWCSAFFMVQLLHLYMMAGKTIALTIQTFVGKVMSLLFNMLSRYVIAFLPRSKHILIISWLQSPYTWFWSPRK